MAAYSSAHNAIHPASFAHAAPVAAPVVPAGTFVPGTVITVGAHTCTIERYLSEGGFAHVYLVRLSRPYNGNDVAVLKRVAVPDKDALQNMRTEVESMKRLRGHKHIVTYIDSHASHLKTGGYEVFLLMEYCSGGGLIDFMNTRLKNRLTEPEVLHIFNDIAEGVASMHYLEPPLIHRDLKVENVLIASSRRFVLCDFGSSCNPKAAPRTTQECRTLEEDVMKHTTLQYRSPEMIDVYRKQPIDEKSDIWALGVLLYKLCYYTTPFEEHGQLAILNAKFNFPMYPEFSDRLKKLIASMLRENPAMRPNIYLVLREVCSMRGKPVPIKDIYSSRSPANLSDKPLPMSPPANVVAYQSPPPQQQKMVIPEITPMRRGRPQRTSNPAAPAQAQARPRPVSNDPFAALDAQRPATAAPSSTTPFSSPSPEDVVSRFPSLDQFDLMHQSGSRFDFKPSPVESAKKDLNTKVMERLADEAFAKPMQDLRRPGTMERERLVAEAVKTGEMSNISLSKPLLYEPKPTRPEMTSKGTMTSPTPSPPREREKEKIPTAASASAVASEVSLKSHQRRPSLLPLHRTSTQPLTSSSQLSTATLSSRPSLEVPRSASSLDVTLPAIARSKSANSKPRPQSVHIESNMDFLRDLDSATTAPTDLLSSNTGSNSPTHIPSNVDFLRSMESPQLPTHHHLSHHHPAHAAKRSSLPSLALGTTRNLLSSKFGEAFRRFEHPGPSLAPQPPITPPSPSDSLSSEWNNPASLANLSPEKKREIEKKQAEKEERRVRAKAEEYKRSRAAGASVPTGTSIISTPTTVSTSGIVRKPLPTSTVSTSLDEPTTVRPSTSSTPAANPPTTTSTSSRLPNPQTLLVENHRDRSSSSTTTNSNSIQSPSTHPANSISLTPVISPLTPNTSTITGGGKVPPPTPAKPVKLRTAASQVLRERVGGQQGGQGQEEDWERGFERRFPKLEGEE